MEVLEGLVNTVMTSYSKTEVKTPVLLLGEGQPLPPQYYAEKIYTYWRLDIKHVDKFKNATDTVFANMRRFVKDRILSRKNMGSGEKSIIALN